MSENVISCIHSRFQVLMIMNSNTRLLEHVHLAGAILSIIFHIAVNHCAFDLSDAAVNMQISLDLFHIYYAQILNHAKPLFYGCSCSILSVLGSVVPQKIITKFNCEYVRYLIYGVIFSIQLKQLEAAVRVIRVQKWA